MWRTVVHSSREWPAFVTALKLWHEPQAFRTVSLASPSGSCPWLQTGIAPQNVVAIAMVSHLFLAMVRSPIEPYSTPVCFLTQFPTREDAEEPLLELQQLGEARAGWPEKNFLEGIHVDGVFRTYVVGASAVAASDL